MRYFEQSMNDQFIVMAKRENSYRMLAFMQMECQKELREMMSEDLPKINVNFEEIFPSLVLYDVPLLNHFIVEAETKFYYLKEFELADFSVHDLMAHRKDRNISISTVNAMFGDIVTNLTLLIMKRDNILISPEKILYSKRIGKFILADFFETNPKKFKHYLSKDLFSKLEVSVNKYFEEAPIGQPLFSLGLICLEIFMIGRCSPAFIKKTITSYANNTKEMTKIPLDPLIYSSYLICEDQIKTYQSALEICMNYQKFRSKTDYLVLTSFLDSSTFRETLLISSFSAREEFGLPSGDGDLNFLDFSLSGEFINGRPHGEFQINKEKMKFSFGKREDFLIKEEKMSEKNLSSILFREKIYTRFNHLDHQIYSLEAEAYSECIIDLTEVEKESSILFIEKLLESDDSANLSLIFSSLESSKLNLKKIEKDYFFIQFPKGKVLIRVENFNLAALFERIRTRITIVKFESFFPSIESFIHELFFADNTHCIKEIVFKNACIPVQLLNDFFNVSSLIGINKLHIEQPNISENINSSLKDYFNLSNLTHLSIPGLNMKDQQFVEMISCMASIEYLDISGCELIGSESLESLSQKTSIKSMNISNIAFEEDSLSILLFGLTEMEELIMYACKGLSDNILCIVCPDSLKNLKKLEIGGSEEITDKGISVLLQSEIGMNLKSLSMKWLKNLSDESLKLLCPLKLQELSLKGSSISSEGLKAFSSSICMNNLKSLDISFTSAFTQSAFYFRTDGTETWSLMSLDISHTNIHDSEFSRISSVTNLLQLKARCLEFVSDFGISKFLKESALNGSKLETIDLSENKIYDEIFEDFASLFCLKSAKIDSYDITSKTLENFFFSFPYEHLDVQSAISSDFLKLNLNSMSYHPSKAYLNRFRMNTYTFFSSDIEPFFSIMNSSVMPLSELRELDLSMRGDIYDNILVNISMFESLSSLKILKISNAFITDAGLLQLVQTRSLSKLDYLDLSSCFGISDGGIKEFYNYRTSFNLSTLLLNNLNISEIGFLALSKAISLSFLQFLSVNKCKNYSMKALKEMANSKILTRISKIDAQGTIIDRLVLQKLGSILEKKKIVVSISQ